MEWTEDNTLGLYEKIFVLCDPNHPKYYNKLHKHLPTRSSEQLVDNSAQPVRRNAPRIVRTGRAEPRAVTLRQIAQDEQVAKVVHSVTLQMQMGLCCWKDIHRTCSRIICLVRADFIK